MTHSSENRSKSNKNSRTSVRVSHARKRHAIPTEPRRLLTDGRNRKSVIAFEVETSSVECGRVTVDSGSVAEWLACWTQAQKVLSSNRSRDAAICLRQTAHTHRASVHQAVKLVAALLKVARVTAGLAESKAAYRRVYDSRHLQADCQKPGSAPEPYAR